MLTLAPLIVLLEKVKTRHKTQELSLLICRRPTCDTVAGTVAGRSAAYENQALN